jgi:hypothetical protein
LYLIIPTCKGKFNVFITILYNNIAIYWLLPLILDAKQACDA